MTDATATHVPQDRADTLPAPPPVLPATPVLISDAMTPLAGETLLSLMLRLGREEP